MIHFKWYRFSELSTQQLYSVLTLRSDVFVVEQNCAYADPDGRDTDALHLLGIEKDALRAYLRLFPPSEVGNTIIFGRVVVEQTARSEGYGKKLLQELIDYCDTNYPGISIKCSAQHHLTRFYEHFGFKTYGDIYDEDGIPHIGMRKNSN